MALYHNNLPSLYSQNEIDSIKRQYYDQFKKPFTQSQPNNSLSNELVTLTTHALTHESNLRGGGHPFHTTPRQTAKYDISKPQKK